MQQEGDFPARLSLSPAGTTQTRSRGHNSPLEIVIMVLIHDEPSKQYTGDFDRGETIYRTGKER